MTRVGKACDGSYLSDFKGLGKYLDKKGHKAYFTLTFIVVAFQSFFFQLRFTLTSYFIRHGNNHQTTSNM